MASGAGSQIALTKIGSLYMTIQSVDQWFDFTSESIKHTLEEIEEASITGRRDAPPSHKGLDYGAGEINFEPKPNALGHMINATFGTYTSSLLTHAGSTGTNSVQSAGKPVFWHQWTPRASAFDSYSFNEPYTVMVYRDQGSAFFFDGVFTGLQLSLQAGQLMTGVAPFMARNVRRLERTAAINSLASRGGRPWTWDMASMQVASGGASSAYLTGNNYFESFELNFTVPHEGVALLDGTKKYAEFQSSDFRRVEISGTLSFRDQTQYDAFVNYERRFLKINLTNTTSAMFLGNPTSAWNYALSIEIPGFKFLDWDTPIGGPNRLTTQFRAKAEYDEDAGFMIRASLINVTSVY
jgi:hypothetical protein